ncbi:MAG: 50S ribosomal protein L25, partial [Candidimonas sp.]
HASILTMDLDGKSQQVLLRAVQWHPYKQQVLHVDFQRVDATRAINTKVPFHFINAEAAPAVKLSGAVISHVLTEIDIVCLPADLPQFVEVDLSGMVLGARLHLADIALPTGVAYAARGGDTNPLIATAQVEIGPADEEPTEGAAPAADAATPEPPPTQTE